MNTIVLGPNNDSEDLTELERNVLAAAIAEIEDKDRFAEQIRRARVGSRTGSGVGFMTKLDVPADAPAANPDVVFTEKLLASNPAPDCRRRVHSRGPRRSAQMHRGLQFRGHVAAG